MVCAFMSVLELSCSLLQLCRHVFHSNERPPGVLGQASTLAQDHVHLPLRGEERRRHGLSERPDMSVGRLQRPRDGED